MQSTDKCCANCIFCHNDHAGHNIVFHICTQDKAMVEAKDRACNNFKLKENQNDKRRI